MAHDTGFFDVDSPDHEMIACFFGYAGGVFYSAFGAEECNAGVSGNNQGVVRTADDVLQGLCHIENSGCLLSYPDPKRITDVIRKVRAYIHTHPECHIMIHYS